jgi:hypothetical protein
VSRPRIFCPKRNPPTTQSAVRSLLTSSIARSPAYVAASSTARVEGNWNLSTLIAFLPCSAQVRRALMNGIIYLIGLVVVIMAILSLLGLR